MQCYSGRVELKNMDFADYVIAPGFEAGIVQGIGGIEPLQEEGGYLFGNGSQSRVRCYQLDNRLDAAHHIGKGYRQSRYSC